LNDINKRELYLLILFFICIYICIYFMFMIMYRDRLLASVLKMHRSNKISLYPRGLC